MEACRLCGANAPLLLSHILPAFAFRWLRDTSGTGYIRNSAEPNQRVQDGIKKYWLCADCETRFSRCETAFANKLFHPFLKHSGGRFPYDGWLLYFCTSISWRLLKLSLEDDDLNDWTPAEVSHAVEAEKVWREYLLGKRMHPGGYRQHLIPMDAMENAGTDAATNINRYLMRAVHMDLCRGNGTIFTYGKLGRFIIIGTIHESRPHMWKGSKVHGNQGVIEPRKYVLPKPMWGYLNEKARQVSTSLASVSPRQQEKIDQTFKQNIDRFAGSDAFRAMQADVEIFGRDAFTLSNVSGEGKVPQSA